MTFVRLTFLAVAAAIGFTSCREVVPPPPLPPAPKPERKIQLGKVTAVSVADFFVLQQSEKVLTFDARPRFFFNLGHIPGAISFPKADLSNQFPKHQKEIKAALAAGKTIVIYCTDLSCPDARALGSRLAQAGYSSSVLTGGWDAWKESGLPVESF